MTSTLERPPLRRPSRPAATPAPGPLGPGVLAAAWAAGAGLVALGIPLLLAWATDSRSGSGAAAATRSVGQLWLLAHGTSLSVPGGQVGLTPLGLTLLPLALLHRAGRHGARTVRASRLAEGGQLLLAIAVPYALLCAVAAPLCATDDVRPAPVQAVLAGLVVALVGAGSGVLREARLGVVLMSRLPARAQELLRATAVVLGVLVAAGALLAAVSLLQHAGRASALAAATDPGLLGGVVLLAVSLACIPNAALWGSAWLAGPGFAVGAGTSVGPFGTSLGAVPAVPLLAALPTAEAPTWLAVLALAVPVLAGGAGGWLVVRRVAGGPGRAALEALALGPCVGVAAGVLAWVSGGPLGGARMADVGPSPWRVGLAVALEVGLAAGATGAAWRWRRRND